MFVFIITTEPDSYALESIKICRITCSQKCKNMKSCYKYARQFFFQNTLYAQYALDLQIKQLSNVVFDYFALFLFRLLVEVPSKNYF